MSTDHHHRRQRRRGTGAAGRLIMLPLLVALVPTAAALDAPYHLRVEGLLEPVAVISEA